MMIFDNFNLLKGNNRGTVGEMFNMTLTIAAKVSIRDKFLLDSVPSQENTKVFLKENVKEFFLLNDTDNEYNRRFLKQRIFEIIIEFCIVDKTVSRADLMKFVNDCLAYFHAREEVYFTTLPKTFDIVDTLPEKIRAAASRMSTTSGTEVTEYMQLPLLDKNEADTQGIIDILDAYNAIIFPNASDDDHQIDNDGVGIFSPADYCDSKHILLFGDQLSCKMVEVAQVSFLCRNLSLHIKFNRCLCLFLLPDRKNQKAEARTVKAVRDFQNYLPQLGDFHLCWIHMKSIYDDHHEYKGDGSGTTAASGTSIENMGSISSIASLLGKTKINKEYKIFHSSEHVLNITVNAIVINQYYEFLKKMEEIKALLSLVPDNLKSGELKSLL